MKYSNYAPRIISCLCFAALLFHATTLHSIVSSSLLDENIKQIALDKRTNTLYAITDATHYGITLGQIQLDGELNFTAVHEDTFSDPFAYLTLSYPTDLTKKTRIIAATYSEGSLFNKIMVTDGVNYSLSGVVADAPGNNNTYGINTLYATTEPDNYFGFPNTGDDGTVLGLAANASYVFALAKRGNVSWLCAGSALNSYSINDTTLTLSQVDQEIIDSRNFVSGISTVQNASNSPLIHYSQDLNMIYVANNWITSENNSASNLQSVALFNVNNNGVMNSTPLHGLTTWANGSSAATQNMIGVSGAQKTLSVHALSTLYVNDNCYLIIAGGHGTLDQTGNSVWMLPLVPSGTYKGCLANTLLTDFGTRATDSSQLYTANTPVAKIGQGPLPWGASIRPSAMHTSGETVYIATATNTGSVAGIYYSQANFDTNKKIKGWSKWALAAAKELGNSNSDGSVIDFIVNPKTAEVIAIPQGNPKKLNRTSWQNATTRGAPVLTRSLKTRSLGDPLLDIKNIVFDENATILSAPYVINDVTKIIMYSGKIENSNYGVLFVRDNDDDDIATAENYKIALLPDGFHRIRSIGYTEWTTDSHQKLGIFLLGTLKGLYAFLRDDNTGGDPTAETGELDSLDSDYFTHGRWIRIHETLITQSIEAIYSEGNSLYIHERGSYLDKILDKIYRIEKEDVITNTIVHATPKVIAESNDNGLPDHLYSSAIIPDQDPNTEQIAIGTQTNMFYSNVEGGVQEATKEIITYGALRDSTPKAYIKVTEKNNQLESLIIDTTDAAAPIKNVVYSTHQQTDTQIIPEPKTTVNIGTANDIIDTNMITLWNDGNREVFIYNKKLYARTFGDNTSSVCISDVESTLFKDVIPRDIYFTAQGKLSITTDKGTLLLG